MEQTRGNARTVAKFLFPWMVFTRCSIGRRSAVDAFYADRISAAQYR